MLRKEYVMDLVKWKEVGECDDARQTDHYFESGNIHKTGGGQIYLCFVTVL